MFLTVLRFQWPGDEYLITDNGSSSRPSDSVSGGVPFAAPVSDQNSERLKTGQLLSRSHSPVSVAYAATELRHVRAILLSGCDFLQGLAGCGGQPVGKRFDGGKLGRAGAVQEIVFASP